MIKSIVVALLLASTVAACSKPLETFATRDDVTMRVVAPETCGYCKQVDYLPAGRSPTKIRVDAVLVRPQDIDFLLRNDEHVGQLQFAFKAAAQSRILEASRNAIGSDMAIMVGDRVVIVFRISSPFSKGSEIDGLTPSEADSIVSQIADDSRGRR